MALGQSNADVHVAGPFIEPDRDLPDRVLVPADGRGCRGLLGRPRQLAITGFKPARGHEPRNHSMLYSAGVRLAYDMGEAAPAAVIIRSEARGGRPFIGYTRPIGDVEGVFRNHDDTISPITDNFIETMRQIIAAAKAADMPVRRVYISWLHGEADRAMKRDAYRTLLAALMDHIEAAVADTGCPIEWLLVQSSGTGQRGSGNCWPNRMAGLDLAAQRANVTVPCATYGLPMLDGSHFDAAGKALLGEMVGRHIALREAGDRREAPQLRRALFREGGIDLEFTARDALYLDTTAFPLPEDAPFGFAVWPPVAAVEGISITGPAQLRVHLRGPVSGPVVLRYAYNHNPNKYMPTAQDWPWGRGCLRTTASWPSLFLPGRTIHDWVAGFEVTICGDGSSPPAGERAQYPAPGP